MMENHVGGESPAESKVIRMLIYGLVNGKNGTKDLLSDIHDRLPATREGMENPGMSLSTII